jgi:hypothetical protein
MSGLHAYARHAALWLAAAENVPLGCCVKTQRRLSLSSRRRTRATCNVVGRRGIHVTMDAYSLDLRKKMVEAKERGMPTSEVAKTFGWWSLGLTRFREPVRVKRSSSMEGVEDGQKRQAVFA